MATLWFALIAAMLTAYVVLDGFDLGAGILHLWVADSDEERRTVLAAIGPVWDGNEVWLVAAGGLLLFAFPRVYAAAMSGFYLPLMMLLWAIVLRGVSIEFRSHGAGPLWRAFWDGAFALSSALVALLLGVALGNVLRGVPLDASGYFSAPLFTDLRVGPKPGALDWYTGLVGAFAVVSLAAHAAVYLAWKTNGAVRARCRALSVPLWVSVGVLFAAVTAGTAAAAPVLFEHLLARPWSFAFPVVGASAVIIGARAMRRAAELWAFLASCAFLSAALGGAAAALFPWMLRSSLSEAYSLDVYASASNAHGLAAGLLWWIPAAIIAVGYFALLFRSMRGKVQLSDEHSIEKD
jgi:cytochrome d ubiquinol oxidase subunit II